MQLSKLNIRRVRAAIRHRLGFPASWVERELAGRSFTVREGTLADVNDYDDAWIHACAMHATIAFDVGANVGQSTLLLLAPGTVQQVVLVDANASALAVAADNLIRNQLSGSCRFVRAFAGDQDNAIVEFWTVGTGAAGSMYRGHAVTAARAGAATAVPTLTLDSIAEKYTVVPDLVKIDIEGAEHKALLGSSRFASRNQTRFMVEMHSPPELSMARNTELVLDWANKIGYAVWYLSEGTRLTSPDSVAHRGRCHFMIQPASWDYPAWLTGIKQSAPLPT